VGTSLRVIGGRGKLNVVMKQTTWDVRWSVDVNQCGSRDHRPKLQNTQLREPSMSAIELTYLLGVISCFAIFTITLFYGDRQASSAPKIAADAGKTTRRWKLRSACSAEKRSRSK
jgi:hypothetical protein